MIAASQTRVGARARPDVEAGVCVVHLVRRANGIGAFQSFLDSYQRHPAGAHHELALVLKGFDGDRAEEPYRSLADGLPARWLTVSDDGFDLGAYNRAARMLPHERLLFLNSFSELRVDEWLLRMVRVADGRRVGAVGASGSWGSQSSHTRYGLGLGGPYEGIFDDPLSTHQVFAALTADDELPGRPGVSLGRRTRAAATLARQVAGFPAFPAAHLRTNGFLIDRDLWLRVCSRPPRDKLAAHRMESGRRGMTTRIRRIGLRVLVVGRDGQGYEPDQWPDSRTFWQGNQENLLIDDNQTRAYENGSAHTRLVLSRYAWGPRAAPAEPQLAEVH